MAPQPTSCGTKRDNAFMRPGISVVEALGVALVVGAFLGITVRWALGQRSHLGFAASVLSGIVGAFLALVLALWLGLQQHLVLELVFAALGTLIVLVVATLITRRPDPEPAELVAKGESHLVEFKATARRNRHSGQRDEKIELLVAKTIAALFNGDGGHLLIGVADDGTVIGLDDDLPLMKHPDIDRYELWLRDFLSKVLGGAATSALRVTFPVVSGQQICHIRVPRSARPVYVTPGRNEGPQLWVRVGNSTRQLPLDQALAYAADRFGWRRVLHRVRA